MAWVFNQSAPTAFRVQQSKTPETRYRHSFGGPAPKFKFAKTGSRTAPLLIATLDLSDPRINLSIPYVEVLPLVYPFMGEGDVRYHVEQDGTVRLFHSTSRSLRRALKATGAVN
jgi:hypothetical protein